MRIILATGNRKKLVELERILDGLDVDLVPMTDLGLEGAVEDGDTFEANALIKARAVTAATGDVALADDSGLEVDALDGAPGVWSARYAGTDHPDRQDNDDANNARLLRELGDVAAPDRSARFVCVAALTTPDGREWTTRGTMEGVVLDAPRTGDHGFGYDPLFLSAPEAARGGTRSNAQLSPAEKDAMSHRGAAFRAIRSTVEQLVREAEG